jgi:RHS repeat-associated protein
MNYGFTITAPSTTGVYTKTKDYTDDGTVEIIKTPTTITIRTYIGRDAYSAPLYVEKIKNLATGVVVDKKYYLHRDYLGSIIAISDENGAAIERRHFDAWGNLAKLQQNGAAVALPTDGTATKLLLLDRGYTSHEHLSEVGLIHMNGRLYDPVLRSFLMPDNFIQQPENTQNYNRYAYVLNNPLMYTDPSGETGIEILGLLGSMGPAGLAIGGAIMLGSVLAANWDKWGVKDFFNDNVSNAFKDTTKWFGKQGKSIGKFFSNMFKKSSRFDESKVTSLNYASVNTTNTISNSFTAGSSVASGGFQSNYRGTQNIYFEGVNNNNSYSFDINDKSFNDFKGAFNNITNRASIITNMVQHVAQNQIIAKYKAGGNLLEAMKDFKSLNGLRGVNKVFQRIGYAGLAIDGLQLASKIYDGKAQNSDYLRIGISFALTAVAISNPVGIIAVGAYGVFDYYYGDTFWKKTGIDN